MSKNIIMFFVSKDLGIFGIYILMILIVLPLFQ